MAQQNLYRTLSEALRWAIVAGDLDAMRASLAGGADANAVIEGQTLLCHVISQTNLMTAGHVHEIVAVLLAHGADVNGVGPDGLTPLLTVLQGEDPALIRQIMDANPKVNFFPQGKVSPLYLAVEGDLANGEDWRTRLLLAHGAKPDLHIAALEEYGTPTVRLMLEKSAGETEELTATGIRSRADFARHAQHLLNQLPAAQTPHAARHALLRHKADNTGGKYKLHKGPRP